MKILTLILMLAIFVPAVADATEPTRSEARIERMLKRAAMQQALAPLMPRASGRERERLNRDIIRRYRRELYRENRRSKK
jgi:hypothetical protein